MIEDVLPPDVASVDTVTDEPVALFPAEVAVIARAVDKRRREFTTVRACARRALAALGVEPRPIVPGEGGAPAWPPGIVGSMTHCAGYHAAAVARAGGLSALGIDAEPHAPLPAGVLRLVASAEEREELTELARRHPSVHWDRLLFSAKESVYKAWFPLTRTWLGFEDVQVSIAPAGSLDPSAGTFVGRLRAGRPIVDEARIDTMHGRWTVRDSLVLTSVVVRPGA